jgi:hypothetical protein
MHAPRACGITGPVSGTEPVCVITNIRDASRVSATILV